MKNMFKKTAAICIFAGLLTTAANAAELSQLKASDAERIEKALNIKITDAVEDIENKMPYHYNYEGVASVLNQIGILRGNGTDFMLDQIPDRIQACVMVVRMRGEEAQALAAYEAGEITCPFTDITDAQAWAKPYLAWLYDKKITLGVGDGKFGNSDCTAQMYTTFMLRALGYEDVAAEGETADFSFDDALTFAEEKALWDDILDNEDTFHRGIMAAVTYQTLTANIKSNDTGSSRLLDSLTEANAVDADAAQEMLEQINLLEQTRAIMKHAETPAETIKKFSFDFKYEKTRGNKELNPIHTEDITKVTCSVNGTLDGNRIEKITAAGTLYTERFADFISEDVVELLEDGTRSARLEKFITAPVELLLEDGNSYIKIEDQKVSIADMEMLNPEPFCSVLKNMPYYAISAVDFVTEEDGSMTVVYDLSDYLVSQVEKAFAPVYWGDGEGDSDVSGVFMQVHLNADGTVNEIEYRIQQDYYSFFGYVGSSRWSIITISNIKV